MNIARERCLPYFQTSFAQRTLQVFLAAYGTAVQQFQNDLLSQRLAHE